MHLGYILAGLFVASQASASSLNALLHARQSAADMLNGLPEKCKSDCQDSSDILIGCGTGADSSKCACKSATVTAIAKCSMCLVDLASVGGAAAQDSIQKTMESSLEQFKEACKTSGYPIDDSSAGSSTTDDKVTTSSKVAATGTSATRSGTASASVATGTSGSSTSGNSVPGLGSGASKLDLGLGAVIGVAAGVIALL